MNTANHLDECPRGGPIKCETNPSVNKHNKDQIRSIQAIKYQKREAYSRYTMVGF